MSNSDFDKSHPVLSMLRTSISGQRYGHRCLSCGGNERSNPCENHEVRLVELPKRVRHPGHVPENFKQLISEGIE